MMNHTSCSSSNHSRNFNSLKTSSHDSTDPIFLLQSDRHAKRYLPNVTNIRKVLAFLIVKSLIALLKSDQ
jgi:hypothetical protein